MRNAPNIADRLNKRIQGNTGGSHDLTTFLLELGRPQPTDRVLDLGCGLGSHVVRFAPQVQAITALDVSHDLLEQLAVRLGSTTNVVTVCCDMDAAASRLPGQRFDLVMGIYALYYSQDVRGLVGTIAADLVAPGGRLLTLSPDVGNNAEWFRDLSQLFVVPDDILETSWTSRRRILPAVLHHFGDVRCVRFVNAVRYDHLDVLMSYYDGCGHYCPANHRDAASAYFSARFREHGSYVIVKRALAILATVPGTV